MIARLSIAIVDVNLPLVVYGCFLASVSFCDVQSITSLFKYIYICYIDFCQLIFLLCYALYIYELFIN